MKLSARNVLKGKVKRVTPGAVNTEIVVEVQPGLEIVSVVTRHSAEALGVAPGKDVYAVIKASSVMLMAE